ncbi:4'-phosphopantetheinyl transferase superfamily protein [Dickeya chrysanthemi]|uniref:4'-phosphopantetheinyl transferase family protein n=1 Tax=Dickeya chrysanthemi TaxID=556 RepID=UPI0025A077B5|nr:4'-phosphopantetheinyl transferase superfamily protein [Dickeya chrysanthemi]WJM86962.1 4'-phosphopantetheinyl transferase superfamily protein [Dickeya chrysanthemi]
MISQSREKKAAADADAGFIERIGIINSRRTGIFTVGWGTFQIAHFNERLFRFYDVTMPPVIASSVRKRQAEFLAGRFVAATVLKFCGVTDPAIEIQPDRAPRWPAGYIGSISHTNSRAVAVVANSQHHTVAGIDVERVMDSATLMQVLPAITVGDEWRRIECVGNGLSAEQLGTLIFSAKESLFKALSPVVNKFFDFTAATLTQVRIKQRRFTIQLTCDWSEQYHANISFTGRFYINHDAIVTLLVV